MTSPAAAACLGAAWYPVAQLPTNADAVDAASHVQMYPVHATSCVLDIVIPPTQNPPHTRTRSALTVRLEGEMLMVYSF